MFRVRLAHVVALFSVVYADPEPNDLVVRKVKRDAPYTDSTNDAPRVRRSTYYAFGERQHEISSEDSVDEMSAGPHCVVWGDWSFTGRRFRSKEDADQHFKQKAHTELAAIYLHGNTVVKRFSNPRLRSVKWDVMKRWCSQHEASYGGQSSSLAESEEYEAPPSRKIEMSVGRNGVVTDSSESERKHFESSLFEHGSPYAAPSSSLQTSRQSKFDQDTSDLSVSDDNTGTGASTLSGKAMLLEKELVQLGTTIAGLLQSVGIDGSTFEVASLAQAGGTRATYRNPGNLHLRITSLEQHTSVVQEKTNALELEFFGATTAEKASANTDTQKSFKGRIERMLVQLEELKGKVSALASSPLLSEASKLEVKATQLAEQAKHIFAIVGVDGAVAPAKPRGGSVLKARLSELGEYVDQLQHGASLLEYEILGSSWNLNVSGPSSKGASIKDQDASLVAKVNDLESRLAALASAPIVPDVDRLEDAVGALASRAAFLSTKVGASQTTLARGVFAATKTATLNARVAALSPRVEKMQHMMASLEEELAGSIGTMPALSQKGTLKGNVEFLGLSIDNLNARMSALEQQV
jgi:hypothetical protein